MRLGVENLPKCRRDHLRPRILPPDISDHGAEGVRLSGEILPAGRGALDSQAQLEIFFVADQDIRKGGDGLEGVPELRLSALPERGPVIEIETDAGAILHRRFGERETESGGECGDESAQMDHFHAFIPEDAVQVEVFRPERPADFSGAVVPDARAPESRPAVGDVDLVPVAPRAALGHFRPLDVHPPAAEIGPDECRERMPFDKGGQDLDGQAQTG